MPLIRADYNPEYLTNSNVRELKNGIREYLAALLDRRTNDFSVFSTTCEHPEDTTYAAEITGQIGKALAGKLFNLSAGGMHSEVSGLQVIQHGLVAATGDLKRSSGIEQDFLVTTMICDWLPPEVI